MADLGRLTGEAFIGFARQSAARGPRAGHATLARVAAVPHDSCDQLRLRGSIAFSVLLACLVLAGCMSEDVLRYDGVTTAAGDAIAANSVMQMVDPWPAGVEDTRFATPVVRPGDAAPAQPATIVDLAVGNTNK